MADKIVLPSSGLAEEILAQFVENAQNELDQAVPDENRERTAATYHLVTFRLGKEEYGVEIESVQEIIRASDITPVPGAPDHVRGVINLRGKIIPVVDLRTRFSLPVTTATDTQRIIVIECGPKRIGMLVDGVSQVIKVSAGMVEEVPEEAQAVEGNYVKGVGKLDNRLIIILDLNRSLLIA